MRRASRSLETFRAPAVASVVAAVLGSGGRATAGVVLRPVAVSGRTAPDTDGRTFYHFEAPSLNQAGQVAFNAWLPHTPQDPVNPVGVWSGAAGALRLNALQGAPSPAPNQPPYVGFATTVVMNSGGDVLFGAALPPSQFLPGANGLFVGRAGDAAAPRAVAAAGMEAPEARSKQFFNVVELYPPRLGGGGHAAFTARLGGKEIEEKVNDTGVWRADVSTGARQLLARAGQAAPGTAAGVLFSENAFASGVAFHPPAVDHAGNVAFVAHLRGPDVNEYNDRGLWYHDLKNDRLSRVARHEGVFPGNPSTLYEGLDSQPTVANGKLAFRSLMYGPPPRDGAGAGETIRVQSDSERFEAILIGPPDAPKIVAATLTRPLSNYRFEALGAPVLNSRGEVFFWADLQADGQSESTGSLWAASAAARQLLVTGGSAAPGAGVGVVFDTLSAPSVNDAGGFAFAGTVSGAGVDASNDGGIWVGSVGAGVEPELDPAVALASMSLVAREGQVLDLGDGTLRTIRALDMLLGSNAGEDGGASGFNQLGGLAFVARFTDGSEAVLVATTPEPAAASAIFLACGALLGRRRRCS
jgi:hypothetical protein